jgi:hypothetical protein
VCSSSLFAGAGASPPFQSSGSELAHRAPRVGVHADLLAAGVAQEREHAPAVGEFLLAPEQLDQRDHGRLALARGERLCAIHAHAEDGVVRELAGERYRFRFGRVARRDQRRGAYGRLLLAREARELLGVVRQDHLRRDDHRRAHLGLFLLLGRAARRRPEDRVPREVLHAVALELAGALQAFERPGRRAAHVGALVAQRSDQSRHVRSSLHPPERLHHAHAHPRVLGLEPVLADQQLQRRSVVDLGDLQLRFVGHLRKRIVERVDH